MLTRPKNKLVSVKKMGVVLSASFALMSARLLLFLLAKKLVFGLRRGVLWESGRHSRKAPKCSFDSEKLSKKYTKLVSEKHFPSKPEITPTRPGNDPM